MGTFAIQGSDEEVATPHNVNCTTTTALDMKSALCPLARRCRTSQVLWVVLVVCVLYLSDARGTTAATESSIQRNLRQSVDASLEKGNRELSVFGKDGRQHVVDPALYPYSAVGLLRWNDNVTCTATLVAPKIVLTAAECVLNADGKLREAQGTSVFSLPQTIGTHKASVTQVYKQSDFWTKWMHNTYVLIELDNELGRAYGVLHLPTTSAFRQDAAMKVQLVGYGSNGEAGECFQLCTIHFPSEFNGPDYMLHHDCDVSAKRSPGSPMLIRSTDLETYIVGFHTNAIGDDQTETTVTKTYPSYNDTVANRGVLGSFVQPHLSFLLQQAESSSTSTDVSSDVNTPHSASSSSPSSSYFVSSASNSGIDSQGHDDQADAGASKALAPPSAASSSAETSVAAPALGIAATAAYSCIGLVCASWLAIIFIAARRIRSNR
ncbi:unnamed protein product [Phytophthora lilii]|uniref:Unnamed protein product n=1 Tax=Phytophthora lilii TaxID=2077276 RepID=A0A9W6TUM2_9STRA|nr:unnamed protein product [Phytophthora lilii]